MSSKIPKSVHFPAEAKKMSHKNEPKETTTANVHRTDGVPKSQKENVTRKNVAFNVHRGVSTRYEQHTELKEQNQNLIAAKAELKKFLSDAQQKIAEMKLQFSDLERENIGLHKSLKDCHVLLVAAKIDPVSGEKVREAVQQDEDQRQEIRSISTDLLQELKAFGDAASQQRARIQDIQATMTELSKSQEHMLKQRENFSLEAAEMEKALQEAEALLM